jgi:hypothetical protein
VVCAFIGQILDGEICTLSVRVPGSSERGEIVRAPIVEASVDGMFRVIGGVPDAFDDAGFEGLVGVASSWTLSLETSAEKSALGESR